MEFLINRYYTFTRLRIVKTIFRPTGGLLKFHVDPYFTEEFIYQNHFLIALKTFRGSSMNLEKDVIESFLTYSQVSLIDIYLKLVTRQPLTFFEFLCFFITTDLLDSVFYLRTNGLLYLHEYLMCFIVRYQMCFMLYGMVKLNRTWYNNKLLWSISESNSKKTLLIGNNAKTDYNEIRDFISFGIKRHYAAINKVLPFMVFQIEQDLNIIVSFKTLFNKFVILSVISVTRNKYLLNINHLISNLLQDDYYQYKFTNEVKQYLKELEIPFRILNICYIFDQQTTIRIVKTIFNAKDYIPAFNLLNKELTMIDMLNEATNFYYCDVMYNKDLLSIIVNHVNKTKS